MVYLKLKGIDTVEQAQNYRNYYLKIESDIDKDMAKVFDLLIEKMEQSGVKLDITEKRYGEIPKVDIKEIEKKIATYEVELQKNGNKELFNNLIASYEEAIVYYSAINDSQYVTYNRNVFNFGNVAVKLNYDDQIIFNNLFDGSSNNPNINNKKFSAFKKKLIDNVQFSEEIIDKMLGEVFQKPIYYEFKNY